jgi:hypothetical protein
MARSTSCCHHCESQIQPSAVSARTTMGDDFHSFGENLTVPAARRRPYIRRRTSIFALFAFCLICVCLRIGFVDALDSIIVENVDDLNDASDIAAQMLDENLTGDVDKDEAPSHPPSFVLGSTGSSNHLNDRLWGSSSASATSETLKSAEEKAEDGGNVAASGESKQTQRRWGSAQGHDTPAVMHHPHLRSDSPHHINPPEGFTITARVYIDSQDKLTHFDLLDDDSTNNSTTENQKKAPTTSRITLPYFECGVAGSTTAALPVKQIYFRHSLAAPTSVFMESTGDSSKTLLYPVLAVALTPLTVELDSGEHMDILAGDVVLFEDSIRPGHKLMVSKELSHLTILVITLPYPHYHVGKQNLSIKAAIAKHSQKSAPCRVFTTTLDSSEDTHESVLDSGDDKLGVDIYPDPKSDLPSSILSSTRRQTATALFSENGRRIRYLLFGTIGLSLSTLMADFLGRTAPLWLAVGVGGTCFVLGSTYGITLLSDSIYTSLSLWNERRLLEKKRSGADDIGI